MTLIDAPETPESRYIARVDRAHRKQWGQFFTPAPVAELMADWVAGANPARVCDPAAGTGILVRAMQARLPSVEILALEKDPTLRCAAAFNATPRVHVLEDDYLTTDTGPLPGIILNPPYVRHRHLAPYAQSRAALNAVSNDAIPKMANLYIYFCVKALRDLAPGGRAALLLPGEWMNANFAIPFKSHLMGSGALREIVAFSNCSDVFEDALTTASLVLLEAPA